jgi:tripartite-type tricarboxylate transporter receptor subunit TctC
MRRSLIALVGVITLWHGPVFAQWREEPLKIIVPFAAGGAVDQVARIIAAGMPSDMTVIVENRGGAGGEIGVIAAAKAVPDGKTVLLHTSSLVINPIVKGTSAEAERMFEPILRVGETKFVLVVPAKHPKQTLAEFVAGAKDNRLTYASTGPGTTLQIAAEMLKEAAGFNAVHVPYRGLSPAFTDLLAGNVDFMVTSVTGVLPYVKSGTLRALATFNETRAEELPQVPTTGELGYSGLKISNWYGLFVASGTPVEKRMELEAAFAQAVGSVRLKEQLAQSGIAGVESAKEFKANLAQEFTAYRQIVKRLGIVIQ